MLLGKAVRLNRLLSHPSGRFLSVAMDHGIALSYSLAEGLDRIPQTLAQIMAARPDALTLMKGVASECFAPYAGQIPWIMQTTAYPPHIPTVDYQLAFVEEALSLGADAIAMTISVVGDEQGEMVSMLGRLVCEARPVAMPVIGHIYPKGGQVNPEERYSLEYVKYAAHVGVEVGVDIVKVPYTGSAESFAEVVESCPIPVVAAGGPRTESLEELFAIVRGVVESGALGITIGRNVWQARNIWATLAALDALVHRQVEVEQALEVYHSAIGQENESTPSAAG